MLHILIGEDDFSLRQALGEIKRGLGDPAALAPNTSIFDGQVAPEQLQNAGATVPFLADKRLVLVEGLLARFEPKTGNGGKKPVRKNGKNEINEEIDRIAAILKQVPDFTELVLVDGKIGNHNPLLRELAAVAKVQAFPLLKEAGLRSWIEQRVKAAGGSIATGALARLVRFVGGNLWAMAGEVDKLVLFAGSRRIEEADVEALVSDAQEASVFALVDAVMEFKPGVAQERLQQLLRQGAAPAYILVMLARQLQVLVRVTEMKRQGLARNLMQAKLGLTRDFVFRKALEQAGRYSPARLKEFYHRLLEADLAIKTGRYEGELALTILLAELGQRGVLNRA